MVQFNNSWDKVLEEEFEKPYYLKLREILKTEYAEHTIYPNMHDIFTALKVTSYTDTKVVILGQDPYHGPNQAHGMAFSVNLQIQTPPSLQNIYKELNQSLGCYIPNNGYLMSWAEQGVLLLNTVLTVRAGEPQSHKNIGWEIFTDKIISLLNEREESIIFMLWGAPARKKAALITGKQHYILEAPHPSPLSAHRGFFGCNHFKEANEILVNNHKTPIDWQIKNI